MTPRGRASEVRKESAYPVPGQTTAKLTLVVAGLLGGACAPAALVRPNVSPARVETPYTGDPLQSPRLLRPGQALLRPDRVLESTDTLVLMLAPAGNGAARMHATLVRRVVRTRVNAAEVLREMQHYEFASGVASDDTLDVDASTLAPLRYFSASGGGTFDVRIDGTRITGWRADTARRKASVDADAGQPFFVSIMTEAFAAAFPFDSGATREIPVANPPAPDVHVMALHVTAIEALRTATGSVPCFVVVGPRGATMWLARDDGHIVRMRWTLSDGSTVWKLPMRDAPPQ